MGEEGRCCGLLTEKFLVVKVVMYVVCESVVCEVDGIFGLCQQKNETLTKRPVRPTTTREISSRIARSS